MSRQHRPQRHVRGPARAAIVALVWVALFGHPDPSLGAAALLASAMPRCLRALASALHCRPAALRRCLLGRVVSARAAQRILTSAGWRWR